MTSIIIFLAVLLDNVHCLVDRFDMMRKGEELTTLLGVVALANVVSYGFVSIHLL